MDIRCQCGKTWDAPGTAIGAALNCASCGQVVCPIASGTVRERGDFAFRLVIRNGPTHVGVQALLGGRGPIEVGSSRGRDILLPSARVERSHCKFVPDRSDDGVAHWAHLGGFLGGVTFALLLLIARQVNARGGDMLSVVLGRFAWPLIGKPSRWKDDLPASILAKRAVSMNFQ